MFADDHVREVAVDLPQQASLRFPGTSLNHTSEYGDAVVDVWAPHAEQHPQALGVV
jgi:hypothetical protein